MTEANSAHETPAPATETPVRIFISSPADVRPERLIARRLIERLNRQFQGAFEVEALLWEQEPLVATEHFQTLITPPHETDIVVMVLWSRLGVTLPVPEFLGPITNGPVTGTQWEFEDAYASYKTHNKPDLLVYRKTADPEGSLKDRAVVEERLKQQDLVEGFFQHWFMSEDGKSFEKAFNTFANPTDFEAMLEDHLRGLLEERLKSLGGAARAGSKPVRPGNPFRGLQSFELEHAPVFFGRTRARNEVREALARRAEAGCAFVLVFGASGSGKSSLVKAGVLADLKLAGMIGSVALCRHAIVRPAELAPDLIAGLARALLQPTALPELPGLGYDADQLARLLSAGEARLPVTQGLAAAAKSAALTPQAEARLALVVDQLEELFTIEGLTADLREAFVAALEGLACSGLVWVLATMRSDFFDRLASSPRLAQLSAGEGRYLLTAPETAELGQIIRQPAREGGLLFEKDLERGISLDEDLLQDATKSPGALPLLEFTLDQLWQRRTADGRLTFEAYRALGGLEGALGQRAEEVYQGLAAEVQAALPEVLRALATVGQGARGAFTARMTPLAGFPPGSNKRALIDAFLAPEARLLVAGEDDQGALMRVAHEALLTHWPRAQEQLEHDRADLQVRGRIEQAAAWWQAAAAENRADRLLAPGLPLAEAEDLLQRRRDELDPDLVAFIDASAAAARKKAQRQRRIRRAVLSGLTMLAIAASGAAVWGWTSQQDAIAQRDEAHRQARIALAGKLGWQAAALAKNSVGVENVEKAAALAVESWRLHKNAEAWVAADALLSLLPTHYRRFDKEVDKFSFSTDGNMLRVTIGGEWEPLYFAIDDNGSLTPAQRSQPGASGPSNVKAVSDNDQLPAQCDKETPVKINAERYKFTAAKSGNLMITDRGESGEEEKSGEERSYIIPNVAAPYISHDRSMIATEIEYQGHTAGINGVQLHSLASGRQIARLHQESYFFSNATGGSNFRSVFAKSGRFLVAVTEPPSSTPLSSLRVLKIEQPILEFHELALSVTFSPDSQWLLIPAGQRTSASPIADRVYEVNVNTGKVRLLYCSNIVSAVGFSSDGRLALFPYGSVDLLTGKFIKAAVENDNLKGMEPTERSLKLNTEKYGELTIDVEIHNDRPNGRFARVINAANEEIARVEHEGAIQDFKVSNDKKWLATASVDKSARLVSLDLDRPFELLCERAGRNLSEKEWKSALGEGMPYRKTCTNWRDPEPEQTERDGGDEANRDQPSTDKGQESAPEHEAPEAADFADAAASAAAEPTGNADEVKTEEACTPAQEPGVEQTEPSATLSIPPLSAAGAAKPEPKAQAGVKSNPKEAKPTKAPQGRANDRNNSNSGNQPGWTLVR